MSSCRLVVCWTFGIDLIIDVSLDSLRWLPSHASPFQSFPQQDWQACNLPARMHGSLGYHIWSHCSMSKLRWTYCLSIHAGFCRSSIFCKSHSLGERILTNSHSLDVSTICLVGTHVKNLVSELPSSIPAHLLVEHSRDLSLLESKPIWTVPVVFEHGVGCSSLKDQSLLSLLWSPSSFFLISQEQLPGWLKRNDNLPSGDLKKTSEKMTGSIPKHRVSFKVLNLHFQTSRLTFWCSCSSESSQLVPSLISSRK